MSSFFHFIYRILNSPKAINQLDPLLQSKEQKEEIREQNK
jgi:hypothetical protein